MQTWYPPVVIRSNDFYFHSTLILSDNHYSVEFKWQKIWCRCCCISVVHCCPHPVGWCVDSKPQLTQSAMCSLPRTAQTDWMWSQTKEKVCRVKLQRPSEFFNGHIVQFLLRPAGKRSRSLIQTRLKAQGNLRLVTTNVRLNSSSHYLWGERERVRPKTIQRRASHRVKTQTHKEKKTHTHKAVREQADVNHLHKVLHFI